VTRITEWAARRGPKNPGRDRGIEETTERVRQLMDGIESAVAVGDDLALTRYLAPPALGILLAQTATERRAGRTWLPARAGLRWSTSNRSPAGPGGLWLRLRFEDRSEVRSPAESLSAAGLGHALEVELVTTSVPWRLRQAEEIFES